MEKSFRQILNELSREKTTVEHHYETVEQVTFPSGNPFWTPDFQVRAPRKKGVYPKSVTETKVKAAPQPEPTPPPPTPQETLIPLEKLVPNDQVMTLILIELGASELREGVAPKRVKKAYRRLVMGYHPDRLPQNLSEYEREKKTSAFFKLQMAYETLSASLQNY